MSVSPRLDRVGPYWSSWVIGLSLPIAVFGAFALMRRPISIGPQAAVAMHMEPAQPPTRRYGLRLTGNAQRHPVQEEAQLEQIMDSVHKVHHDLQIMDAQLTRMDEKMDAAVAEINDMGDGLKLLRYHTDQLSNMSTLSAAQEQRTACTNTDEASGDGLPLPQLESPLGSTFYVQQSSLSGAEAQQAADVPLPPLHRQQWTTAKHPALQSEICRTTDEPGQSASHHLYARAVNRGRALAVCTFLSPVSLPPRSCLRCSWTAGKPAGWQVASNPSPHTAVCRVHAEPKQGKSSTTGSWVGGSAVRVG